MPTLFDPADLGSIKLRNRIVMAPLTRSRAEKDGIPSDLHVEYYSQRARNGLVVTEGTFFEDINRAFVGQAGIATDQQQAGWAKVAQAVHEQGGQIVMQIMHGGRLTLPSINGFDQGEAPSAIAPGVTLHGADGRQDVPTPVALDEAGIQRVISGFAAGARRAIDAGIDGVEIHGANGYLLHEFLSPDANHRTDSYGGSPENRARLLIEVIRAVAAEVGADRVGFRISPMHNVQGCMETDEEDVVATYNAVIDGVKDLGLAYLSILHHDIDGPLVAGLRARFGGFTMLNSGFGEITGKDEAQRIVEENLADAVMVGREVISNPDLSHRWEKDLPLNEMDMATFYTPGAAGYTDYPFAEEESGR